MWDKKIIDVERLRPFALGGDLHSLSDRCRALLAQQQAAWPRLAQGVAMLDQVRRKTVALNAWPVEVQYNPGRAASSLANTHASAIASRPCFLCAANSPPEQEGLRHGAWVLLVNPAPIVPGHLTVVHEGHVPQEIGPRLGECLGLAEELGPAWTIFYNGPRAGASAPDHMHFQAAPAGRVPMEQRLEDGVVLAEVVLTRTTHVRLLADSDDPARRSRCVISVTGGDLAEVEDALRGAISRLPRAESQSEPMLNLLVRYADDRWAAMVFPRAAHRPACYFADGEARILLSPGVMDMAGLVITVRPEDFDRTDANVLAGVFREVGLGSDECRAVLRGLSIGHPCALGPEAGLNAAPSSAGPRARLVSP